MQIQIAVENGFEAKSIAWVLAHPGCFAYGANASEAILKVPQVLVAYQSWIGEHTNQSWLANLDDFDVRLVETFDCYKVDSFGQRSEKGHNVSGWFQSDWNPLSHTEVQNGLKLLSWTRMDLLGFVSDLTSEQINRRFSDERWSIAEILSHIASAEIWYLSRLGIRHQQSSQISEDSFEQLKISRELLNSALIQFEGKYDVKGLNGEFWSPRKILRRAAWHERDHIMHILRLTTLK